MCHDCERINYDSFKIVPILTRKGPVNVMGRNYQSLLHQIDPFFPSFCARNKPSLVNEAQADYGIMRQVAERG